ncbi:MBL fold metallo-hydrolase RNA specificity domain-containing protein [Alloalcanivorax xenomutans]|uniref:MBL fold metallo-hydrolase RNA specificity domain-containing protein n=1 Tax=Alloalcanivorax xenomutans TaxID=1094342 RepID=UPI0035A943BA
MHQPQTTWPEIRHHGAVDGVTGSAHELCLDHQHSLLVDCGLFQGRDQGPGGANADDLTIDFPVAQIKALVITHVHIDHVGRIPWLLAAGFKGPILCSQPSAKLLPIVLEDAFKLGFSRRPDDIDRYLRVIKRRLVPLPYDQWHTALDAGHGQIRIRLRRAGHILGSAYVECDVKGPPGRHRVVFSGDLGAPHAPMLPAPKPPHGCDTLVIESTYGDRNHEDRKERQQRLQRVLARALQDQGTVLIPAFSIGRTQELLYELEDILHRNQKSRVHNALPWNELPVILDSPLASRFTRAYRELRPYWEQEALKRITKGRKPLGFKQLLTVDDHDAHLRMVRHLADSARPAVVISGSGMCTGGRIVNYLKAMLRDPRHNVLFVGYQGKGTPGRQIQRQGQGGTVTLDGQTHAIQAGVDNLGGYSAHADQQGLIRFVTGMRKAPTAIRIVHGDGGAKRKLQSELSRLLPQCRILYPCGSQPAGE